MARRLTAGEPAGGRIENTAAEAPDAGVTKGAGGAALNGAEGSGAESCGAEGCWVAGGWVMGGQLAPHPDALRSLASK